MKILPIIHELIKHIQSLPISKQERYFLNGIVIRDTYTQNERNVLNFIRKKYYKELKKIYTQYDISLENITDPTDIDHIVSSGGSVSVITNQIQVEIDKEIIEQIKNGTAWKL